MTAEERLTILRHEAASATDPRAQALLHFELARLLDTHFANDAAAAREHLHAAHLVPDFHAPLYALIRIFGRRGSSRNLAKLYEALRKTASSESEKLSAAYELSNLHERDKLTALGGIVEKAPTFEPAWLVFETIARELGKPVEAWRATMQRIAAMGDSAWRSALSADAHAEGIALAADALGRGDLDLTKEILQKLGQSKDVQDRTEREDALRKRLQLELHARTGNWNEVVRCVHELLLKTKDAAERAVLWFLVAEGALAQNDSVGAEKALAESLNEAPESTSLLALYDRTTQDKPASARAWLNALKTLPKEDAELHAYVARLAFEAGLIEDARLAYELALSHARPALRPVLARPYAQVLQALIDQGGDRNNSAAQSNKTENILALFDEATGALAATEQRFAQTLPEALAAAEKVSDAAHWEWVRMLAEREGDPEARVRACEELAKRIEPRFVVPLLEEAGSCAWHLLRDATRSEAFLRECVKLAPERKTAFRLLEEVLASKGSAGDALALIDNRIASTDDPDELARLYYDRARMLRTEGDLDGVLTALENALLLDSGHLGALALQAETQVAKKDWQAAVTALCDLANAEAPLAQRRLALLGAVDLLEARLGNPAGALKILEEAATELLEDASVVTKKRALLDALSGHATESTAPSLAPEDEELYAMAETDEVRIKIAGLAVAKLAAEIARNLPLDETKLRQVLRWAERAEHAAWIRTACCALRAIGSATPTERTRAAIAPARTDNTQEVSAATLEQLWGPSATGSSPAPTSLLAFARPATRRAQPRPLSQSGSRSLRGVGDGERSEFEAICSVFGARFDDLVAGLDPEAVHVIRVEGRVVCELGIALRSPFSSKIRFAIGRLAFAQRYGVGPALELDPELAVTEMMRTARALGFAPIESIEISLTDADEAAVREGLVGLHAEKVSREACADSLRALREAATRAGVWACGDLLPAFDLARVDPESASGEPAWLDADDIEAAVRFWISGWPAATRFGGES